MAQPQWNLYLEQLGENHYKIILPNENDGSFDGITLPKDGYAVQWPTNPHNTYPSTIAQLLKTTDKFANATFTFD